MHFDRLKRREFITLLGVGMGLPFPVRFARNNCCVVRPCRRATALTVSPVSYVSATIAAFCSAVQRPAASGAGKYLDPLNRPRTVHGFRLKQKLSVRHVSKPSATQGRTIADQLNA
jgi:hypothetical protein